MVRRSANRICLGRVFLHALSVFLQIFVLVNFALVGVASSAAHRNTGQLVEICSGSEIKKIYVSFDQDPEQEKDCCEDCALCGLCQPTPKSLLGPDRVRAHFTESEVGRALACKAATISKPKYQTPQTRGPPIFAGIFRDFSRCAPRLGGRARSC